MAEHCPLVGMQWDGDIPDVCRRQCESIWDAAIHSQAPVMDYFVEGKELDVDIEHGGMALQVPIKYELGGRVVSLLFQSVDDGEDIFSENFDFTCPNP